MGKKKEIKVLDIVTKEYLKAVRPAGLKQGRSDKYSVNLYRFFNKILMDEGARADLRLRVWRDITNHLWFGFKDDAFFIGIRFSNVTSAGYHRKDIYAHARLDIVEEVTEWFYKTYREIGRCIYHMNGNDKEHDNYMLHTDDRYTMSANGKRRTCNWCGRVQEQKIVREVVKHERWEDVPAKRGAA